MEFRVLGPLEVVTGSGPVVLGGARSRALLTALLLTPRELVAAHRLAAALWGEAEPEHVESAVHSAVSRLRRALGPAGALVVTRPPGYLLDVARGSVDAEVFEERLRDAAGREPADALRVLDEALALWRGPAYGEFADGFARAAATRQEELRTGALEDRVELLLRAGAPADAVAAALDLAATHPLRERPVVLAMRALAAVGRSPEALAAYTRHRDHVRDELGLDPSPALRAVHAQVLRAELPATHPTGPGAPRRLPHRPSPIVGRAAELGELDPLLAARALVTLVGPGGVGKTRAALELAHRAAAAGRAVWWVDLVPVTPERLVETVADAVGTEPGADDPVADLRRTLAGRRGLLVLDNAEHLLEPVATLVERLLAGPAGGTVLVTGRERLAVDAETVRALAPFPVPPGAGADNPAVQLFVQRAPGMDAGALTDGEVTQVADVCRRLDGLPLAIELGAARVDALGLPLLIERLGERLDLLAGGRRTADRRHRTLRAVVGWSHDLLDAGEKVLFARLSVFPAAFGLDQAEAVCAGGPLATAAIGPLLARLVEQSLVRRSGDRFTLLETLRAYAAEQLDRAGERDRLHRRHAHDTAGRLRATGVLLWTRDEPAAVAQLTALVDDLHAAFRHAFARDRPLAVRLAGDVHDFAYFRQRLDLLDWGSAVAGDGEGDAGGPDRSRALATAAVASWLGGRMEEAAILADRAVRAAGGPGAPAANQARKVCADLAMFANRTDDALHRYRALAASWRAADDEVRALLFELAALHALLNGGRRAEAAAAVEPLLAQVAGTAHPTLTCWAHYVAGLVAEPDDPHAALAAHRAAVRYGATADCRLFVAMAQVSAAAVTSRLAPDAALASIEDTLETWSRPGTEMLQWWLLGSLAPLLAELGADGDAALLAGAVLTAGEHRPSFAGETARLVATLAAVRARLGAERTDAATAQGATLGQAAAVAHARAAIRAARRRNGPPGAGPQRPG